MPRPVEGNRARLITTVCCLEYHLARYNAPLLLPAAISSRKCCVNRERMQKGTIAAASAYVLWGLLPLFWHALHTVPALEILAQRMV